MDSKQLRQAACNARRVVVKIGSRALADQPDAPQRLASSIATLSTDKRSFVVVSSGAIALGGKRLGYRGRPSEMSRLQAAAAVGQSILMHRYEDGFAGTDLVAAQVLLTHADLASRVRLNNARQALGALLEARAIPIINENDTVSTEEINFGDNDQLAAMVVPLVGAELLVLLTDVPGVLDAQGHRIAVLTDPALRADLKSAESGIGSGGMDSKLDAAYKASRSGAGVVIASAAEPQVLERILAGEDVGTWCPATGPLLRARKHWIAFTLRPSGTLILDAGAVHAVETGSRSVLAVGVLGVRGQFNAGDAVRLVGTDGVEVGRGLARLGALDVARIAGKRNQELACLYGSECSDGVVVHKDDLVRS